MGIGDDIIATGMAKGAKERGKRIAFGDGRRIIWGPYSQMIFRGNPNIAPPGSERANDVEWIRYFKGHRIYNTQEGNHWKWNYLFHVTPGEFFFGNDEKVNQDLIIIEPNVPNKPCGVNKQWPVDRFLHIANELTQAGFLVRQFEYGRPNRIVPGIVTKNFREAVSYFRKARAAILPEGALHHAAAALGIPSVVLFGGFVPPSILGYDGHVNLTGNSNEACGRFTRCEHCLAAMKSISVDEVLDSVEKVMV